MEEEMMKWVMEKIKKDAPDFKSLDADDQELMVSATMNQWKVEGNIAQDEIALKIEKITKALLEQLKK